MSVLEATTLPSRDSIVGDLIDIIAKHTKATEQSWTAETTMEDAGIDSFDFVELIFEVEDRYGISVDMNANKTETPATIGEVADLILGTMRREQAA